ncbi:RNA polymerase subunit sigma-70 [Microlunatus speluncae]|uniref:RNA polymerase subunit sigma-70 n=1 Tax=Microlunatus speluncae TaxID=2594267 RepID=UPI0013755AAC|nr:RNA polymerase subunit sigma-70 [Microlunatus speluncae]
MTTPPEAGADRRRALEDYLAEHRPRLQLHCYRMVGSLQDAEDLTQEAALRAWRSVDRFDGRSGLGTWLYRIATNVCLDHLRARHRERRPSVPAAGFAAVPPQAAVPWLQPYPIGDLGPGNAGAPAAAPGPEERTVARDTIRLAFVAAIQYLPPRQRAALLLRDCLGWSVRMCADTLEVSTAAINSSLQRARATLRRVLARDPYDWHDPGPTTALVDAYVTAIESGDSAAIRALLAAEVRVSHSPGAGGNLTAAVVWYAGADTVVRAWQPIMTAPDRPEITLRPVSINGILGLASWTRTAPDQPYHPFGLTALTVANGQITEVATFPATLFPSFNLPPTPSCQN